MTFNSRLTALNTHVVLPAAVHQCLRQGRSALFQGMSFFWSSVSSGGMPCLLYRLDLINGLILSLCRLNTPEYRHIIHTVLLSIHIVHCISDGIIMDNYSQGLRMWPRKSVESHQELFVHNPHQNQISVIYVFVVNAVILFINSTFSLRYPSVRHPITCKLYDTTRQSYGLTNPCDSKVKKVFYKINIKLVDV